MKSVIPIIFICVYSFCDAKVKKELCDPREYYMEVEKKPGSYLQCTPVVNQVGEWEELECPRGHDFVMRLQKCVDKKSVKRQYISGVPNIGCPVGVDCGPEQFQQQPSSSACPIAISSANPIIGQPCSWTSAGLMPNPSAQDSFLQCTPNVQGSPCGTWQSMACAGGTNYNPNLQVCVTQNIQGRCAQNNYAAVCPCGVQNTCPSSCSCQQNTCCQPPPYIPTPTPAPQLPICPNSQQAISFCVANTQCPSGYTCQNNGCCLQPLPICENGAQAIATCVGVGQSSCPPGYSCRNGGCCVDPLPICSTGIPASQRCVSASSCPSGYTCQNGGCCLSPLPICPTGTQAIQRCTTASTCPSGYTCQNGGCCLDPLPICPTGVQAASRCATGGSCPPSFICLNGGCCQVQCPDGSTASQTCVGTGLSTCQSGFYCTNSACCQLPQCPNGQLAVQVCSPGGTCPSGLMCQNGGCCQPPLPTCPSGGQAMGPCAGPGTCPNNQYCFAQGNAQGCCMIPTCPSGAAAIQPCGGGGFPDCPTNFRCTNGGCCPVPLPVCPNGVTATTTCTGPSGCTGQEFCYADNSGTQGCCSVPVCAEGNPAIQPCANGQACPQGYICQNGGCCPLPMCPNGQPGLQSCTGAGQASCPSGNTCQNGVCCQIPLCPNGNMPLQSCAAGSGSSCPLGFSCQNQGCCQVTCPNGGAPIQLCGLGQTCPAGYSCYMNQCCPDPLPICPNGQRATATCVGSGQSSCGAGFQCMNGGCCPVIQQPAQPVCPPVQQPLCYCAQYNNQCPYKSSCNAGTGTCCANQQSQMYNTVRPGDRCVQGVECPGQSSCYSGYCVCTGNARSNGVTCVAYRRQTLRMRKYDPVEYNDQFGTERKEFESAVRTERSDDGSIRRKPPTGQDLGIGPNTPPLFWHPVNQTLQWCNRSNDCTPDMTCVKHKCHPLMVPGERGCVENEQCYRSSPGSYCAEEGGKSRLCKCKSNRLEYDRKCWKKCPAEAAVMEGNICVKIKMKENTKKTFAKRVLSLFSSISNEEKDD